MAMFTINSSNAASELFKLSSELYVNQISESLRVAQNALAERANKELSKPAVDFADSRLTRPQSERDKLQRAKDSFVEEATLLSTVAANLNKSTAVLTEVKTKLAALNAASTAAERAAAAKALDDALLYVNKYANTAGDYGKNPIGKPQNASFRTSDLVVTSGGTGATTFLQGKFLGAEFTLTDGDGKTWRLDRAAQTLTQYDSYPDQPTGTSYAMADVSLASFDEGTGAVTLNTPGGAVGGTIQKFGVQMLDSFFYNGLSSDQDVANAMAALDSALARFSIDKLPFTGAAVALEGRLGQFNAKIKELDKQISEITSEMISEKAAADKALKAKIQIQQNMLALTVGSSGAMVDLFFRGTIKTGSILDNVKK
ncbi:MAG: hypothetical protein JNM30_14905 [Rhodospirillales bacterium]|nr:hypothetical protein [Rhodospirillales bacterium]